jgi:exopolyphosphatase/guanosine-5'-triphosphate,3'-diphosphate pyrophosphatase
MDHNKNSFYLINASPLVGVNDSEKAIIALVTRYHRRSLPKPSHKEFMDLVPKRRRVVMKLAAILRLAEALDREHSNRVESCRITVRRKTVSLLLKGKGDLLLEKWALNYGSRMFESVYKKKVVIL